MTRTRCESATSAKGSDCIAGLEDESDAGISGSSSSMPKSNLNICRENRLKEALAPGTDEIGGFQAEMCFPRS
jgi:hypothetical protein